MILNLYLFIYFYTAFIYYVYFLSFTSMQSNGPFLNFTTCKMYVTIKTLELELEILMSCLATIQTFELCLENYFPSAEATKWQ